MINADEFFRNIIWFIMHVNIFSGKRLNSTWRNVVVVVVVVVRL